MAGKEATHAGLYETNGKGHVFLAYCTHVALFLVILSLSSHPFFRWEIECTDAVTSGGAHANAQQAFVWSNDHNQMTMEDMKNEADAASVSMALCGVMYPVFIRACFSRDEKAEGWLEESW